MVKIVRPEDLILTDKISMGAYGKNGMGKTTFLSTVDEDIPTLVAYAGGEPGLKVIRGKPHIWVVQVDKWSDLGEVYELVSTPGAPTKLMEMLKASVAADPRRRDVVQKRISNPAFRAGKEPFFGAVGIDTWTRMQALALSEITGQDTPEEGTEAEFISEAPRLPKGYDAWQKIGSLTGQWIRYFARLPIHKIFLFQEQDRHPKFEGDGEVTTSMALTPSALVVPMEILEIVGRIYVVLEDETGKIMEDNQPGTVRLDRKEVRYLFIGKDTRYFAKGDTQKMGRAIRDPSWKKIYDGVVGNKEGED